MAHLQNLQLFEIVFQFLSHKEATPSFTLVFRDIQKEEGFERKQDLGSIKQLEPFLC